MNLAIILASRGHIPYHPTRDGMLKRTSEYRRLSREIKNAGDDPEKLTRAIFGKAHLLIDGTGLG